MKLKFYILTLTLATLSVVSFANFWLIDSNIVLKSRDKVLVAGMLNQYHEASDDSTKIKVLHQLIADTKDQSVWPLYNDLFGLEVSVILNADTLTNTHRSFYIRMMAEYYLFKSVEFRRNKEMDSASFYLQKSSSIYATLGNEAYMLQPYMQNLKILSNDSSLERLNELVELSESQKDSTKLLQALFYRQLVLKNKNQLNEAIQDLFYCLRLLSAMRDVPFDLKISTEMAVAQMYWILDAPENALKCFDEVYPKISEDMFLLKLGWLRNVAIIEFAQDNIAECDSLVNVAYEILDKTNFHQKRLSFDLIKAKIKLRKGNVEEVDRFLKSVKSKYNMLFRDSLALLHLECQLRIKQNRTNDLENLLKSMNIENIDLLNSQITHLQFQVWLDSVKGNWHKAFMAEREIARLTGLQAADKTMKRLLLLDFETKSVELIGKFKEEKKIYTTTAEGEKRKLFNWLTTLIITAVVLLLLIYLLNLSKRRRLLEVRVKFLESEYKLLLSQLNPHFISNAIATIDELVDNDKAKTYIKSVSKLTRQILSLSRKEFVTLEEELDFVNQFVSLEKLRFPDMQFDLKIDTGIELEELIVPPILLQPFVENAIKYGIDKSDNGKGRVALEIVNQNDWVEIRITDNGKGHVNTKSEDSQSTDITKERLENFFQRFQKRINFNTKNLDQGFEVVFQIEKP
ncbi:MAG: histidine kinase [Flavobacteriales bacterium]|nr:histidine kinase [Flavobacteriales bacterium]